MDWSPSIQVFVNHILAISALAGDQVGEEEEVKAQERSLYQRGGAKTLRN
jgi:hypothetical protein